MDFRTEANESYIKPAASEEQLTKDGTLIEPNTAVSKGRPLLDEVLSSQRLELLESPHSISSRSNFKSPKEKRNSKLSQFAFRKSQSISENEAQDICMNFKDGGSFVVSKSKSSSINEDICFEVKILPYPLQGDVYKIIRVSNMEPLESKANEPVFSYYGQKVLPQLIAKPMSNWKKTLMKSRTEESANTEIPDEKNDVVKQIANQFQLEDPFVSNPVVKNIVMPVEDSRETNKKTDTKQKFSMNRHGINEIDVRNSLNGKGAPSTKSYSHMDLKLIKILNDFFGEEKIRFIIKVSYTEYI